jgi:hypothetical protein
MTTKKSGVLVKRKLKQQHNKKAYKKYKNYGGTTEKKKETTVKKSKMVVSKKPTKEYTAEDAEDVEDSDVTVFADVDDDFDYEIEDDILQNDADIKKYNQQKRDNEKREHKALKMFKTNELYPTLNDPNFAYKIAEKKEFFGTQYNGPILDIKKEAERWCERGFTIMPHQHFVKNFISKQTPYNSLILYFGLGSGKTCAGIGIAEQTRQYMRLNSFDNPIMVIAKPSIQKNFEKELFDNSKLYKINAKGERVGDNTRNAVWNIENCVGNTLLSEINPNTIVTMKRADINDYIKRLIAKNYSFYGYDKLRNYIVNNIYRKLKDAKTKDGNTEEELAQLEIHLIQKHFNNRLMIIDEVHNIRLSDATNKIEGTKTSDMLLKIVKHADLKLILLSATPMYNKVEEIIWLTNLVNLNDGRSIIKIADVFDPQTGKFAEATTKNKESGEELLRRKLIGYVSFIRGENPFIFPYRIYPSIFAEKRSIKAIQYPKKMTSGRDIKDPLKFIDVYVNGCGEYQRRGYKVSISPLTEEKDVGLSYSYKFIQKPLQCLNIVYPSEELDNYNDTAKGVSVNVENIVGDNGLRNVMKYRKVNIISSGTVASSGNNEAKKDFEYLPGVEHIFKRENLGKYSAKMANICDIIAKSEGIVMIYSQYLESGIIPMALALEEMGYTRFGYHNLFKMAPVPNNGSLHYTIISGIAGYSPEKLLAETIDAINSADNRDGNKIKVVLITKAGSEGLDFANIRQVHIMDSWFNMSRIEQIIGRAVRTKSHCRLPFEKRCVEIYMHATYEPGATEYMDMYLYRIAEKKAIKMGQVTRLMKEVSVDCLLNMAQSNFTVDKLMTVVENRDIELELSSKPGLLVPYKIGDKPYTAICDYMADCNYRCHGNAVLPKPDKLQLTTYSVDNLKSNYQKIANRIRELFREENMYFYKKRDLINRIQLREEYDIEEIYYVLRQFITKREILIDEYGNKRHLLQKGDYYAINHAELGQSGDEGNSTYDVTHPIQYKPASFTVNVGNIVSPQSTEDAQPQKKDKGVQLARLLRQMEDAVNDVFTITEETILAKGEKSWYKHLALALPFLKTFIGNGLDDATIRKYVVEHAIDIMTYEEQVVLIDAIYGTNTPLTEMLINSALKTNIVGYFNSIKLKNGPDECIPLVSSETSKAKWSLLNLDEDSFLEDVKGVVAERLTRTTTSGGDTLVKNRFFLVRGGKMMLRDIDDIANPIMFILKGEFKKKDLENPRAVNSNGAKLVDVKNEEIKKYIEDLLKVVNPTGKKAKTYKKYNDFAKLTYCAIVEIIVRYFTDKQVGNKVYYLRPFENVYTMGNATFVAEKKR